MWERTEDEFLCGRQHVQGKCDLVLVSLALEPAEHLGRVEHGCEEEGGCRGQQDDGCEGGRVNHGTQTRGQRY